MPILAPDTDLYPTDLFDMATAASVADRGWWALYTRSRHEKQLMRRLLSLEVPFYAPLIAKQSRTAGGRTRTSHLPLFASYVFMYGDEAARSQALTSGCISRWMRVADGNELTRDLRQIHELIRLGRPLTPEARIVSGDRVRVISGTFKGFEGLAIRRENETRLLVSVNFTRQGASVLLDDFELEPIS